jgi:hypothetical protein
VLHIVSQHPAVERLAETVAGRRDQGGEDVAVLAVVPGGGVEAEVEGEEDVPCLEGEVGEGGEEGTVCYLGEAGGEEVCWRWREGVAGEVENVGG